MSPAKYQPRHLRPAPEKELTQKQRMQIRIRRLKPLPPMRSILAALLLFLAFLLADFLYSLSPAAAASPVPENSVLVADFAGDVMLGGSLQSKGCRSGYAAYFANVSSWWDNANLVAVNLENAVLNEENMANYQSQDKNINIYCTYDAVDNLVDAGVNMLSCANEHSFDFGERPVSELISYMQQHELIYAGVGMDLQDAHHFSLTEINGIKVAFLSITDVFYKEASAKENRAGILTTGSRDYNMLVYTAAMEADLTIVYMHWGEEYAVSASKQQKEMAHQLIDAGADLVIGSHPHVVQAAECYHDGVIFYSLGNFIFDQGNTFTKDSAMVQLVVAQDGSSSLEVIPLRIRNGAPALAGGMYASRIKRMILSGLDNSEYYYNDAGHIIIPAFTVQWEQDTSSQAESSQRTASA